MRAILPLVAGYHEESPLLPAELAPLYDLIRTRLAMSVLHAIDQQRDDPENEYLAISQEPIRLLAERLEGESADMAHFRFRDACGYRPVPTERAVVAHVTLAPTPNAIRLENGRPGGYLESRGWYGGEAFETDDPAERRTVHLGVDVWHPAGEPVHAALDGVVEASEVRPERFDFGGTVILRHFTEDGTPFFTLYGHLSHDLPTPGTAVTAGDRIGMLGTQSENGGWEPHLHFQLLTSLVGMGTGVHGVAAPSELDLWESISPDPNLLLRSPARAADRTRSRDDLRRRRRTNLSQALSISYREPLEIVRGERAYLYDSDGTAWLDLVNNVCHVGHAHPRVTAALADQAFVLNTNTRYLHPALVTYARRLAATLPDPLSVVFLTNSGSEANDLALRLARAHTGRRDVLALEWAYHGNLSSLIDISQYKFDRPGGTGCPAHVRLCKVADPYRGTFGDDGPAYADDVLSACAEHDAAAFIIESLPGCAGQIELATGYLPAAFAHARNAGAVCIADEVQVGFGRVGSHFWGFETQGVVPDIVTMGKPIGNGHPLGAVVTTPQIAHVVRQRHGVLQHLRRQPGLGRRRPRGAGRDPRRAPAGARARARRPVRRRPARPDGGPAADRRRARPRALPRRRAGARPAHPRAGDGGGGRRQGGREGAGDPALDRRPVRQRAQDQAAARDHRGRRRPRGRGHRPRHRRAQSSAVRAPAATPAPAPDASCAASAAPVAAGAPAHPSASAGDARGRPSAPRSRPARRTARPSVAA